MNAEQLKQLVELKDKAKASQSRRDSFEAEWLSYVAENGLNEAALKFLFGGFEYRKCRPFVKYLKEISDRKEAVQALFSCKEFYANKQKSFKVCLNLLALLFVELVEDTELMLMPVRRLPELSFGKDKKRYPEIGKFFGKYFISEFYVDTVFPRASEMGLRPAVSGSFFSLMHDGIKSYCDTAVDVGSPVVENLKKWVLDNIGEKQVPQTAPAVQKTSEEETPPDNNSQTAKKDVERVEENSEAKSSNSWKYSIARITGYIENLEKKNRELEQSYAAQADQKERVTKENEAIRAQLSEARKENAALDLRLHELEYTISTLKKETEKLQTVIDEKDREIADRIRLAEMVSMDRSKQSDATLVRLSRELSSYYEDFMSAKDDTITLEFAEILRDQLNDVYSILKKHGISL